MIKNLVPTRLKEAFWKNLDILKLNRLAVQSCNIGNLRSTSAKELTDLFNDQDIYNVWISRQHELGKLQLPEMSGGVNPGDQRAIFYLINYLKSKEILEVGTHIGCSTVNIALAMKSINDSRLITVDITDVNDENKKQWKKFGSKNSPKELLNKIDFLDRAQFITMNSVQFLTNCKKKFDLIFLDGSHLANVVYQEIPLALNLLNMNGVILLHDYFPDNKPLWSNNYIIYGPQLVVKKLKKECQELDVLPLGSLPWKTKLNSNSTSLALLTRNKHS